MLGIPSKSRGPSTWTVLLGILCICLVVAAGVVSATHSHCGGEASHQDCSLCVTVHMTVQIASSVTQVVTSQVFTRVDASSPVERPQFTPQFALFSRPPPAGLDRS